MTKRITYKDAGVDIEAGERFARAILEQLRRTANECVLDNPLGFAGLYALRDGRGLFDRKYRDPVLVSSTDGVGTKLKIAFMLDKHDTVGLDLVAMSVNDILVQGAAPLFFLDYIGTPDVNHEKLCQIIKGIADGCIEAGCALIGGEKAVLPDLYNKNEYDLAGFAVGVVERSRLITGRSIRPGDTLIGLSSTGLHSNGYTLVRKIVFDIAKLTLGQYIDELGCTLGEELLRPTRIYVKPVLHVLRRYKVKQVIHGIAHITGGGLPGNVVRILPMNCVAQIRKGSWSVPPIFPMLQRLGNVEEAEMFKVFNMGVGLVLVVSRFYANAVLGEFRRLGLKGTVIGEVVEGDRRVAIV